MSRTKVGRQQGGGLPTLRRRLQKKPIVSMTMSMMTAPTNPARTMQPPPHDPEEATPLRSAISPSDRRIMSGGKGGGGGGGDGSGGLGIGGGGGGGGGGLSGAYERMFQFALFAVKVLPASQQKKPHSHEYAGENMRWPPAHRLSVMA